MGIINSDFAKRIDAVDWGQYETAYGRADNVPELLKQLICGDRKAEIVAAGDLSNYLCHQTAYVSSASLPAFPFLLEVLRSTYDELAIEILDIFTGFDSCSCPEYTKADQDAWKRELRKQLTKHVTFFSVLMKHEDEVISDMAESIIENLIIYPS